MNRLPLLDAELWDRFPDPRQALAEPNGLLAFGGDLSPRRLLAAYSLGIFPWFGEHEPILWWSPDPRCVFHTEALRINRSLRRQLKGKSWRLTVDQAFDQVIRACAAPRASDAGTWLVPAMIDAYVQLHRLGHAHSVEVWDGGRLVGGIYGVAIGRLFCGESMFSAESGGSKLALAALATVLSAPVQDGISRQLETRADMVALQATNAPQPFIALQRNLALRSLADPTPPAWSQWWFGTHPTVLQRIALAKAF